MQKGLFATYRPPKEDPPVKGPVGFLNAYFASPMFQKRAGANYAQHREVFDKNAPNYRPKVKGKYSETKKDGTVYLSPEEAKREGMDLFNGVLPHEYSHLVRELSPQEEYRFIDKEKNPAIKQEWMTEYDGLKYPSFSHYLAKTNPDGHDFQPNEQYGDLNTLRWMLYKSGVYDTRKGDLTPEQFKKFADDPKHRDNFFLKRLREHFSDEDIIRLNNEVAYTGAQQNKTTV